MIAHKQSQMAGKCHTVPYHTIPCQCHKLQAISTNTARTGQITTTCTCCHLGEERIVRLAHKRRIHCPVCRYLARRLWLALDCIARHIWSSMSSIVAPPINPLTRRNQPLTRSSSVFVGLTYLIHVETRCTTPAAWVCSLRPRVCRSSSIGSENLSYKIYIFPPFTPTFTSPASASCIHSPHESEQVLSLSVTLLGRCPPSFSCYPRSSLVSYLPS